MEITPAQVKELRERTGVGMMDCKKALVEASGDDEFVELDEEGKPRVENDKRRAKKPAKKKCGRCKRVVYCDARCQQGHWKTHKPGCQRKVTHPAPDAAGAADNVPSVETVPLAWVLRAHEHARAAPRR